MMLVLLIHPLAMHEPVGIRFKLRADHGMAAQLFAQFRVPLDIALILDELRVVGCWSMPA